MNYTRTVLMSCRWAANECPWQIIESQAANQGLPPVFAAHIWAVPCQGQRCIAMRESDHARRADRNLVAEQRQIIERVAPAARKLAASIMDFRRPPSWHKSCFDEAVEI